MATTLVTLPDFIVTIDRADHTVIDQTDEIGNVIRTIDFGILSQVADVVNAWLDLGEPAALDVLAPAMNAYLLEQFAKH